MRLRTKKYYTTEAVNDLIRRYKEKNGEIITRTGSLCDEYLLYGDGLKNTVILEVYLNERSSTYEIKMFKKLPKKYEDYFFNCYEY